MASDAHSNERVFLKTQGERPRCIAPQQLRAPAIRTLPETGTLQLPLFDQRDMASITSPEFPRDRLVVCRNPDIAAERARKREDLL